MDSLTDFDGRNLSSQAHTAKRYRTRRMARCDTKRMAAPLMSAFSLGADIEGHVPKVSS